MSELKVKKQRKSNKEDSLQLVAGKVVITVEHLGNNAFVLTADKETLNNAVGKSLLANTKNIKTLNEPNNDSDELNSDLVSKHYLNQYLFNNFNFCERIVPFL